MNIYHQGLIRNGIALDDLIDELFIRVEKLELKSLDKYSAKSDPFGCNWIFKSKECGYMDNSWSFCNKTFNDCKQRGRQERFNGIRKERP
jgi:hypothetical protein